MDMTMSPVTEQVCKTAVDAVLDGVFSPQSPLRARLNNDRCHVVVLVPANGQEPVRYAFGDSSKLASFYERNYNGDGKHAADDRLQALLLWLDRREQLRPPSADLLPSSGVNRQGVVVSCSGLQPWFNELVSGMIADAIWALARDAKEVEAREKKTVPPSPYQDRKTVRPYRRRGART